MLERASSSHAAARFVLAAALLLLPSVTLAALPAGADADNPSGDAQPEAAPDRDEAASSPSTSKDESRILRLSLLNQTVGFAPAGGLFTGSVKPGLLVGAERSLAAGKAGRLSQVTSLGYLRQRNVQHGVFFQIALAGERKIVSGLAGEALVGIAYFHYFAERPIYDPASGERLLEFGRPALMPSVGLGLSWAFPDGALPLSVFLRQEYLLQTPYAPGIGAGLIPHTALHVGLRARVDR